MSLIYTPVWMWSNAKTNTVVKISTDCVLLVVLHLIFFVITFFVITSLDAHFNTSNIYETKLLIDLVLTLF